jgi:hypothetical protein
MAKSKLLLITPTTVLRTIAPRRPKNADLRTREHLTPDEVARLPVARGSCSRFRRARKDMPHRGLSRSLGALDTLIEMLQIQVLGSLG